MSVIDSSTVILANGLSKLVTWEGLGNGDSGAPLEFLHFDQRSVQVVGTFGSGGDVVWEGSNDGDTYVAFDDQNGNAFSFTAAGLMEVSSPTRYARPRVTAGDVSTDIDCILFMRTTASIRT